MLNNDIINCTRCPLYKSMPYGCKPVPGIGPNNARIFIVGEALGEDEAILSKPFVGQCGKFLDKMLQEAGIDRSKCFVSNVVKCRPTKQKGRFISNRPPTKDEIKSCSLWLAREFYEVNPKLIFTLGKIPTKEILGFAKIKITTSTSLGDIVGKEYECLFDYGNEAKVSCKVVPLYHPSYIMAHSRSDYAQCVEIFRKYASNQN